MSTAYTFAWAIHAALSLPMTAKEMTITIDGYSQAHAYERQLTQHMANRGIDDVNMPAVKHILRDNPCCQYK